MISLLGPKGRKKESPFTKGLRGIPGGVQAVAKTTDSACILETQETEPGCWWEGAFSGHDPPAPPTPHLSPTAVAPWPEGSGLP